MRPNQYRFVSPVWLYPGKGGWHFVTVPRELSEEIRKQFGHLQGGWGSVPVIVTIGKTSWTTSIFPDKKLEAYLLPIKAEVRRKEHASAGDDVEIMLEIRD